MRPLFCPICGRRVTVEVKGSDWPEVHRLPEHKHGAFGNLCAGAVITVTIDYDRCQQCGNQMSKHPSGVCRACYGENAKEAVSVPGPLPTTHPEWQA